MKPLAVLRIGRTVELHYTHSPTTPDFHLVFKRAEIARTTFHRGSSIRTRHIFLPCNGYANAHLKNRPVAQ